ncbi:hypothetical protein ACFE04_001249 [Oxalis oulophora]
MQSNQMNVLMMTNDESEAAVTSSFRSWAQQTQESYQLQLALALRLSTNAASAADPAFLNPKSHDSLEAMSYQLWVNGCLSYIDRIRDGFYLIHGMDPYAWTMSTESDSRVPSFESLTDVDPHDDFSIDVVLIDKSRDPKLKELFTTVLSLSSRMISSEDMVNQLANLVYNHLGGEISPGRWKERTEVLKHCLGSIVFPIGSLSFGLCVHRALLFKALADSVNLPCRIAKGCHHCGDTGSSCVVQLKPNREYLVDLLKAPGALSLPDSSLNTAPSILISSPFCHPKFKVVEDAENFRTLAKRFFVDLSGLDISFDQPSRGTTANSTYKNSVAGVAKDFRMNCFDKYNFRSNSSNNHEYSQRERKAWNVTHETNQSFIRKSSSQRYFMEEELEVPWSELFINEKIGEGSFGAVHRAIWRGSEVAVKILIEKEFHAERFNEFLREVAILKCLRHPNIVLFMGAVTQPPNLSIVTEYLSRGSLYKLLHTPNAKVKLDERRCLDMAYDVAKGMDYLHQITPPIVHRDLKSPNLLVDNNYTVKVCDFGLSRSKANTFLSSTTAVGTPEWTAPEVLRCEQSNEKSDVYSFGVILWELMTHQKPWINLDPIKIVGEVGFNGRKLEIPNYVNPRAAALIEACWASEPSDRPSFTLIREALHKLIIHC